MLNRIVVASSKRSIDELLDKVPRGDCVQLFDEAAIASRNHLEFAYLNAVKLHERGEGKSKILAIELLLCAAMTSQIGDAIKKVGAKSSKRFVLFAENKKCYDSVSKYLVSVSEFEVDKKEAMARIRRLGIASGTEEDLIQEIALKAIDH